jgi:hypothetical protein
MENSNAVLSHRHEKTRESEKSEIFGKQPGASSDMPRENWREG